MTVEIFPIKTPFGTAFGAASTPFHGDETDVHQFFCFDDAYRYGCDKLLQAAYENANPDKKKGSSN